MRATTLRNYLEIASAWTHCMWGKEKENLPRLHDDDNETRRTPVDASLR